MGPFRYSLGQIEKAQHQGEINYIMTLGPEHLVLTDNDPLHTAQSGHTKIPSYITDVQIISMQSIVRLLSVTINSIESREEKSCLNVTVRRPHKM